MYEWMDAQQLGNEETRMTTKEEAVDGRWW